MLVHFKLRTNAKTGCGKTNSDPKNIDWNKVNCRECLMIRAHLKKKRFEK